MSVKRQLMAEQWNEFAREVLPADCSQAYRREMRLAFYAGGQAVLFRLIGAFAPEGEPKEPTEADVQIMRDLYQEFQDFAQALKDRRGSWLVALAGGIALVVEALRSRA